MSVLQASAPASVALQEEPLAGKKPLRKVRIELWYCVYYSTAGSLLRRDGLDCCRAINPLYAM